MLISVGTDAWCCRKLPTLFFGTLLLGELTASYFHFGGQIGRLGPDGRPRLSALHFLVAGTLKPGRAAAGREAFSRPAFLFCPCGWSFGAGRDHAWGPRMLGWTPAPAGMGKSTWVAGRAGGVHATCASVHPHLEGSRTLEIIPCSTMQSCRLQGPADTQAGPSSRTELGEQEVRGGGGPGSGGRTLWRR